MRIVIKFLIIVLMSAMVSVAVAQTPKTNELELSVEDVVKIRKAIKKKVFIWQDDSVMVETLLENGNIPEKGKIYEEGEIVPQAVIGDEWEAKITSSVGTFWLTYVVRRKGRVIGSSNVRLN